MTFFNKHFNLVRLLALVFFALGLGATAMARTIAFIPQSYGLDSQGYEFAPDARYSITLSCVDEVGAPVTISNGNSKVGKIYEVLSFDGLPTNSMCDFLLTPPAVPEGLAGAFNPPPGKKRQIDPNETTVLVQMELYLPKRLGVTLVLDVPPELATLVVSAELTCFAFAIDSVSTKNSALINGARLELRSVPKNAYCSIYVDDNAIKKILSNTPYVLTTSYAKLPAKLDQDTEATLTVKIERSVQVRVSTASNIGTSNLISDISLSCDHPEFYSSNLNYFNLRAAQIVGNELVFNGVPPGFQCRALGVRPAVAVSGYVLLEFTVTTYFKSPKVSDPDFIVGLFYRYMPTRTFTILNSVEGAPAGVSPGTVELRGSCFPSETFEKSNFVLSGSAIATLTTPLGYPVGANCSLSGLSYADTPSGFVWKRFPPAPLFSFYGPLFSFYGPLLLTIEEIDTNTVSIVHTLVLANSALEIELGIPTRLNIDITSLRAVATCNANAIYYSTNVFVSDPPIQVAQGKYTLTIKNLPPNIRCEIGFPTLPEPPAGFFLNVTLPQRSGIDIGVGTKNISGEIVVYANTVAKISFRADGLPSAQTPWSIEGTVSCSVNAVPVYSRFVRQSSYQPDTFAGDVPQGGECVFIPSQLCCYALAGYKLRNTQTIIANVIPGQSFSNLIFKIEFVAGAEGPEPVVSAIAIPGVDGVKIGILSILLLGFGRRRLLEHRAIKRKSY